MRLFEREGDIPSRKEQAETAFIYDAQGNKHCIVPTQTRESILYGPVPRRVGLVTQAGLALLSQHQEREEQLVDMVQKRQYGRDRKPLGIPGTESIARRIYDAQGIQRLFGQANITIVEKYINEASPDGFKFLEGWEIAQALTVVAPAFEQHQFHVVAPLGGTKKRLFLPYYENMIGLHELRSHVENYPKALVGDIHDRLKRDTTAVCKSMHKALSTWLYGLGFTKREDDYIGSTYFSPRLPDGLRLVVDAMCYGTSETESRENNWLLPHAAVEAVQQHLAKGNVREAYFAVRRNMLCLDPFMLGKVAPEHATTDDGFPFL